MTGTVYLVGAGPGDPRLITLRGAEVLRRAGVVVYDRLAPLALLDLAPARAERIDAGKAPGRAPLPQQAINRLLVEHARCGRCVVRLKGGDPFVFGRGGEEALACAAADIPFEVVPGVSAALAAPAYAGIPVTHRGLAASFAVVTACRAGGATADLRRLARAADTLVVMMAAERLQEVCAALLDAGRPAAEPAALIQWASTSAQRSAPEHLAWQRRLLAEQGHMPAAALGSCYRAGAGIDPSRQGAHAYPVMVDIGLVRDRALDYGRVVTCGCPPARRPAPTA